jgi:preprotein translocase subunit SecY
MISAFTNTFKIPELRNRVLFTLAMLIIVRIGAAITCPGINVSVIQAWFASQVSNQTGGSVAALFNIFSGGALENCAVFSLGVMPYISASIMLQLLTAVIPQLGKLAKEDGGRQKIMQYTRYATIALCIFQGYILVKSFESPELNPILAGIKETIEKMGMPLVSHPGPIFQITTILTLTAGTMFLMWLGDQITDRGIGNGMSLIISVGIVARLPAALVQAWHTFVPTDGKSQVSSVVLVVMIAFLHSGPAANQCAIRQACRGPEGLRWPDAVHAAQGELRGRHADHLRPGPSGFPGVDRDLGFQGQ